MPNITQENEELHNFTHHQILLGWRNQEE